MISAARYDMIVIGGGSGGLAAAKKASMLGKKVLLFEKNRLGGTCVNIMYNAANIVQSIEDAKYYGIDVDFKGIDTEKLVAGRDKVLRGLNKSHLNTAIKKGVEVKYSLASFADAKTVVDSEGQMYQADKYVIAVGGKARMLNIPGIEHCWNSDDFFHQMKKAPKKLLIVGSGYIAVELAGVMREMGSEVHLFIRTEDVCRNFDEILCKNIRAALERQGVKLHFRTNISKVEKEKDGKYSVHRLDKGADVLTGFDRVIMAVGRVPLLDNLKLDNAGVKLTKEGFIDVNKFDETNVENIYALGDATPRIQLTPVAIRRGRILCNRLFGDAKYKDLAMEYDNIPTVVFSHPPMAMCGKTTQQVRKEYEEKDIHIYETSFGGLYYSMMPKEKKGRTAMRLVCVGDEQKVVGLHMIGQGCDEMLQGFGVAMKMGATKKDFDSVVAIHPTSSEELVTLKPMVYL